MGSEPSWLGASMDLAAIDAGFEQLDASMRGERRLGAEEIAKPATRART
jgi:hypothetical protein